jgi:N-acetylmuramoyl-L-alanine amidase
VTLVLPPLPLVPTPYRGVIAPAGRQAVIRTCYGEADGEPDEGIAGVAWVIRTRAEWPTPEWWGHTLYGVCHRPEQFDCWIPGSEDYTRTCALHESDPQFKRIAKIVDGVLAGTIADPTAGGTHYKVTGTQASWDKAAAQVPEVIIGSQSFFRLGPSV